MAWLKGKSTGSHRFPMKYLWIRGFSSVFLQERPSHPSNSSSPGSASVSLCSSLPELFELWDAGASSTRCRALEAAELRCRRWGQGESMVFLKGYFGFPEMVVPLNHQFWCDFPLESIHFGVPPFMETSIWPKIGDIYGRYHGFIFLMVLNCDFTKIENGKSKVRWEYHGSWWVFACLYMVYAVQTPCWCFSIYSMKCMFHGDSTTTATARILFLLRVWQSQTTTS